jgi:hypothetical protein
VTGRPQNVRPSRIIERGYPSSGHNSRRPTTAARNEDNQITNRSYNGGHRLDGAHRTDEHTPAQQRSSRVGHHHADQQDGSSKRW